MWRRVSSACSVQATCAKHFFEIPEKRARESKLSIDKSFEQVFSSITANETTAPSPTRKKN
jgi:hypothetical protein